MGLNKIEIEDRRKETKQAKSETTQQEKEAKKKEIYANFSFNFFFSILFRFLLFC